MMPPTPSIDLKLIQFLSNLDINEIKHCTILLYHFQYYGDILMTQNNVQCNACFVIAELHRTSSNVMD